MDFDIVIAGEAESTTFYKILLYGSSGAGKTWAASTSPKPLYILCERQGMATVRRANPKAGVVHVTTAQQLRDILKAVIGGQLDDYDTLVFDGLTEIQRLFRDEIVTGRQVGADFTFTDWRILLERMRRFTRTLRDLEKHVVCTCLATEEVEQATGRRWITLKLEGSISEEMPGYFSVVGYVFKEQILDGDKAGQIAHQVMLDGPSNVLCKPVFPLRGIMGPDLSRWFQLMLHGTAEEADAESTPSPTEKKKRGRRSRKSNTNITDTSETTEEAA